MGFNILSKIFQLDPAYPRQRVTLKDRGYHPIPKFRLPDVLYIDVDAAFAFVKGTPKAGVGIYFENLNCGIALPIKAHTSSEAEASGVYLSLMIAKAMGVKANITCDNHGVASTIGDPSYKAGKWRRGKTPLYATHIVIEAKKMMKDTNSVVEWEGREGTKSAHNLAALTHNGGSFIIIGRTREDFLKTLSKKTANDRPDFNLRKGLNCQAFETEAKMREITERLRFIIKLRFEEFVTGKKI